jgi:hypothetical protein
MFTFDLQKTYNPDQPVKVTVSSRLGGATLVLPSNYVGVLNICSTGGWISVSDKVKSRLTIFSEQKGVRNCFIGDVMQEGYGEHLHLFCLLMEVNLHGAPIACYYRTRRMAGFNCIY